MTKKQKYRLTYKLDPHPDGIAKEDLPHDTGACDQVILHSILSPEDDGLSVMTATLNGITGQPLSANDQFHIWAIWAHGILQQEGLSDGNRHLCTIVHEAVKGAVLSARAAAEAKNEE